MSQEILEAVAALSSEVGALSSALRALEAHGAQVETALNLTNSILQRIEASIGYLRRDVESIQKDGCKHGCDGPENDPDTEPALPSLRAVGGSHE